MIIRKSGKRILGIIITTMFLLCLFPAMQVNAATISVDPSSLTLEAGKTDKVYASVTGNDCYSYSWSSEGGVASVTGNGASATVKGLKAGTGKVKVSVSKITYVSKMVRRPDGSSGYEYVTETTSIGSRSIDVTVTGSSGSGSGSGGGSTVVTHNWDAGTIISEPTCGGVGYRKYTCTECGETRFVTIPQTGEHVYDDGTVIREPGCGLEGYRKYTCTVCGFSYNESIAATGDHTFGDTVVTREPNCTYEGSGIHTCSVCGKEETVTIPTNNEHDYIFDTVVMEGNCTEKGIRRDFCRYCSKTRDSELALNPDYHAEIILDQEEYSANVGDTIQLEPALSEDHCSSKFTYASSDESVASVSEEGLITVLSYGAAQITVQNAHDQKAFCTVHTPVADQFTSTGYSSQTNTLPFATQRSYATTQTIYTPDLLTHAGTISRIAYYVGMANPLRTDEVRIYMEKTSRGSYNSGSDYVCSAPVLVYTGSPLLGSKQGWETYVLDTPFEYDGQSNLAVTVVRSSAGWASSALYYTWQPKDQNMSLSRSNSSDKTYAQITSTQGFEVQAYIPSTRFTLENDVAGFCTENGHDYSEPQVKEANCYFDGYTWRYCKRCGHVEKTNHEYASFHDWDVFDKKEATCNEPGWETYVKCRNCAFSNYLEIPALGHTAEIDEAVSPDCTHTGLTAGTHCEVCGEIMTPQEEIPALGHTAVRTEAIDASCEEPGMTEGELCSVCGEILTPPELIPAEHKMATLDAVEADCTHDGMTEGSYCSVCGMIEDEQEVIPALGHNLSKHEAMEASCTEDGCGEYYECDRCHGLFANDDGSNEIAEKPVIAKFGHSYGEWSTAKEATCTEAGSREKVCSLCGDKITEGISALGHSFAEEFTVDIPASCTKDGSKSRHCIRCDEVTEVTVIPAAGSHTYGDWITIKEPTVDEEGSKEHTCSVCGYAESEVLPKIPVQPVADEAIADAEEARIAAENAAKDAEEAQKAADEAAKTPGDAAVAAAENAKTLADIAKEAAEAYKEAAEKADRAADKAIEQAETDEEKAAANASKEKASALVTAAETAVVAADKAVETASASVTAAENAKTQAEQAAAKKAQEKAAAKQKADAEKALIAANNGIIDPTMPKVKISKPKAAKKSMEVKWKKLTKKQLKKVKGIEIEYSLTPDFRNPVFKSVGKKKANIKIKKLLSKKTYYVRAHTYVVRGGKKYVSNWTTKKKVKIK